MKNSGKKTGRLTQAVLLFGVIVLLSACGRSAENYPILFDYEPHIADALYAYTIPMEESIQKALEEIYPDWMIGYLLPVHIPKNAEVALAADKHFWCTLHNPEGNLTGYTMVFEWKGKVYLSNSADPVDWPQLSGYTSQKDPMTVYKEGIWYFAIIDQTAYCIDSKTDCEIRKTDEPKEIGTIMTVCDIMHK